MIENEYTLKKDILKDYKNRALKLRRLRNKLDLINLGAKSVSYSDMPRAYSNVSQEDLIHDKLELEERIEKLATSIQKMKEQIVAAIDKLENDKHSASLEMYYIDLMNMFDISIELGVDVRTVKRYIKKAIIELDLNVLKAS